jgi:hypothetical protein
MRTFDNAGNLLGQTAQKITAPAVDIWRLHKQLSGIAAIPAQVEGQLLDTARAVRDAVPAQYRTPALLGVLAIAGAVIYGSMRNGNTDFNDFTNEHESGE